MQAIERWVEEWLYNEKGKQQYVQEKEKEDNTILSNNLEWLHDEIKSRERRGAIGILCVSKDYAYDKNSKAKWKLEDPKLIEKIESFYSNYRG